MGVASWRTAFPGHLSQTACASWDGGWRRSGAGCRAAQVQTGGPISIEQGTIVSRGSAAASVPASSEVAGPRYKLDSLLVDIYGQGVSCYADANPPEPSGRLFSWKGDLPMSFMKTDIDIDLLDDMYRLVLGAAGIMSKVVH